MITYYSIYIYTYICVCVYLCVCVCVFYETKISDFLQHCEEENKDEK